jgi:cytidylate kinase
MKKKIITIAGKLGSGKSSTGNMLAYNLGYKRFSMGDIQRRYAEELGMTFADYCEMQNTDHSIDKKVDQYQKEISEKEDSFVLDSRLGWYFIPNSFKVFLELPDEIAVERIMSDAHVNTLRRVENISSNAEEVGRSLTHRVDSEKKRYVDLYNIQDHFDHSHYDLVVRTDKHPIEEVVAIIQDAYEQWLSS